MTTEIKRRRATDPSGNQLGGSVEGTEEVQEVSKIRLRSVLSDPPAVGPTFLNSPRQFHGTSLLGIFFVPETLESIQTIRSLDIAALLIRILT